MTDFLKDNIFKKYDLFIFDLDDTLVKTETFHYNAWLKTLQQTVDPTFSITTDAFFSIFHSITPNNIQNYLKNDLQIVDTDINKVIHLKNTIYFDMINNQKLDLCLLDGCELFIEQLLLHNKKFVIVSNSLKQHIDFFSELFPILKNSSKNYYREILVNRKPHPECYLKVISDFPNMTMVGFEDSITGIHSITAAPNIFTYFINTTDYHHYDYIINNYPVVTINSYLQLL
jgi:beta-phosphoglucomutase-like phosphatase (HAD superfamily)